jgi:GT2 family glycosyltransferase
MIPSDLTIFSEPHHDALELLAVRALANGDCWTAFAFADRRRRIAPAPTSSGYILRAEALYRLGEITEAIADLEVALEASPNDLFINRRMFEWTEGSRREAAAAALIAVDSEFAVLRRAIEVLRQSGRRAFAAISVLDQSIQGWAAWSGDGPAKLTITTKDSRTAVALEPDPFHPLSGADQHAVRIEVPRPPAREAQLITLTIAGEILFSSRARSSAPSASLAQRLPIRNGPPRLTIIVPIYGDYDATSTCIESLLKAIQGDSNTHVLLVDDATPDPRLQRYLAEFKRHLAELRGSWSIDILSNAENLGFVGAVNRALESVERGDVLLLNADTIVPKGFRARLARAAYSAPDIGTVTPLSNNGEFMSFPVANDINPLGSEQDVAAIDAIAARVNAGNVVELPSGIGFCLYITRQCLDRVTSLSDSYYRGYFEDIDLCLRARHAGLRNVCATDVYVGHAGSRSFLHQKVHLVGRNLEILGQRFPRYPTECIAFATLDPLKPARAAIERAILQRSNAVLLVAGRGAVGDVARERSYQLMAEGRKALVCDCRAGPTGPAIALVNPNGQIPQSISFDLSVANEKDRLLETLRQIGVSRIEFTDPLSTPIDLAEDLCRLSIPCDCLIADGGLSSLGHDLALAQVVRALRGCEQSAPESDPETNCAVEKRFAQVWSHVVGSADRIWVPSVEAQIFASRFLPSAQARKLELLAQPSAASGRLSPVPSGRVGFVPMRTSSYELRLLREIAYSMKITHPQVFIVVIGKTLDDIGLMRFGNVFVTGRVALNEVSELIRLYQITAVVTAIGAPLFGHPIVDVTKRCGLPTAYFDWSFDACEAVPGDLALNPALSSREIATELVSWFSGK